MKDLSYFYAKNFLEYYGTRFGYVDESYEFEKNGHYFNAPILHNDNHVESGFLSNLPIPYYKGISGSKLFKKLMKEYFEKVEKLGAKRIALREDPSIENDNEIIKSMLSNGFTPHLFYTTLVHLEQSEEELWQNIRKSYRSLINGLDKNEQYKLFVVDKNNPEKANDWIDLYFRLLSRGSFREKEKLEAIRKSIDSENGIFYLLYEDSQIVAGAQINYYNRNANYLAGGTNPDYEGSDYYSHYILWEAFKDLKKRGFKTIEIGPMFFESVKNFYTPTEKELAICTFKLGMGGDVTPYIIYEK